jgi:type VI protein secretion system component VasF
MTNRFKKKGKVDEDDVEYSLLWTIPEWLFFILKVVLLVLAYIQLWLFLDSNLIKG